MAEASATASNTDCDSVCLADSSSSSFSKDYSFDSLSGSAKCEVHEFNDWVIRYRKSHILPSKCSKECNEENPCIFCIYSKELDSSHLPEMVFPFNLLELKHKNGCCIQFTALDALKLVRNENKAVTIACSDSWRNARKETGLVDKVVGDFDWTFRTDYAGSYFNWAAREDTDLTIDMEKLKQREQILLFRELTLFDDELHDNGIAVCNVRIRVMPSGFFVLLRYFLRVDDVLILVHDARIHHNFSSDYVLLETSHRENKVSELKVPLAVMVDPDEITPLLTLKKSKCEKLLITTNKL